MKSLSEMKHCGHCKPGDSHIHSIILNVKKRLPNPYCRDASCACHHVRKNKEKK